MSELPIRYPSKGRYAFNTSPSGEGGFTSQSYDGEKLVGIRKVVRVSKRTPKTKGWRNPTPFSINVEEGWTKAVHLNARYYRKPAPGTGYSSEYQSYVGGFDCNGYFERSLPVFDSSLSDRAIIKALLKLKDQKVNLGVALGERAQTADQVGDTCVRLYRAVKAARRLDGDGVLKALSLSKRHRLDGESPFNMWLSASYGWKPLLGDIHGSIQAIDNDPRYDSQNIVTVKALVSSKQRMVRKLASDSSGINVVGCPNVYHRIRSYDHILQGAFVRLDYRPSGSLLRTADSLGLLNPFELAWELLPFSFVVDWFTPVGNWLSVLTATAGYDFIGGSITTRNELTYKGYLDKVVSKPSGAAGYSTVTHGGARKLAINRVVYGSSPLPRFPGISIAPSSFNHAMSGISLLASAFSGSLRIK